MLALQACASVRCSFRPPFPDCALQVAEKALVKQEREVEERRVHEEMERKRVAGLQELEVGGWAVWHGGGGVARTHGVLLSSVCRRMKTASFGCLPY